MYRVPVSRRPCTTSFDVVALDEAPIHRRGKRVGRRKGQVEPDAAAARPQVADANGPWQEDWV